ncbi:MFS transporter [Streptomyces murinus]|uniref:MFS transporter n=1 Tax=Streptomyces murinus TaxID=33900 RepID=UPI0033EF9B09
MTTSAVPERTTAGERRPGAPGAAATGRGVPGRAGSARAVSGPVVAGYGAGALLSGTFTTLPGLLLLPYLTDTLGVGAALAGAAVLVPKLWAAVVNPLVGGYARGARARRRLIRYGGAAMAVACALMFASVVPGTGGAYCAEAGFLLTATAFACFQVPYAALPADLATGPADRFRLAAGRVAGLGVAALAVGAAGPALVSSGGPSSGYRWAGCFGAAVIALGTLGVALAMRRTPAGRPVARARRAPSSAAVRMPLTAAPVRPTVKEILANRPFRALLGAAAAQSLATGVLLAGVPYATRQVLGDPALTSALVVVFVLPDLLAARLWARFGARVGTRRAYALAGALFAAGCLGFLAAPVVAPGFLLAAMLLAGAGHAGQLVFLYGLLPGCVAEEAAAGGDRGELLSGVFATGEAVGLALAPFGYGLVLAASGYVSAAGHTVHQSGTARFGILLGLALLPLLATVAGTLSLRGHRPAGVPARP